MARISLTGLIIIVILALALTGFIATKINVGDTHQTLPGITENATAGSLLEQGAGNFADWIKDNLWPW